MRPLGVELSAMLAARGVETIFGIPGVHNVELYRGIEDAGITHVLARNEMGAGFMADGYARASGRPGVAYVITGPGLTNIMTPMGQASSDNVPMLVVSSCLDETAARTGQLHQMHDQEGAARTVAGWSATARTPAAAYGLINRAWQDFAAGDRSARHISVPISVLGGPAEPHATAPLGLTDAHRRPDPRCVKQAAEALAQARKPVIIFGGGARDLARSGQSEQPELIDRLLTAIPAATFVTYAGRGIVPPGHPFDFGTGLARPDSAAILGEADFVLVIGSELAEVDLWRPALGHSCRMMRVDIRDAALHRDVGATWNVRADAASFVSALVATLDGTLGPFGWRADAIARTRAGWRAEIDAHYPGIAPLCQVLAAALSADTMIFSDMTQFAYAAKELWDMPRAGHWHHPSGFGTLGYALPAAIGGAVARPGKPTLAIAGDSGIQYTLSELGTAAELGLSLPILLWDNEALAEIRDCMVAAQIAPNAVSQVNPDWQLLAQAYRCAYVRPSSPMGLADAINTAFSAGRPTLIHATPGISSSS
jgi:acetolactate synthase-1/2/3 large subunit/5-guanidino-2-oxopentanoate decarboxylase